MRSHRSALVAALVVAALGCGLGVAELAAGHGAPAERVRCRTDAAPAR